MTTYFIIQAEDGIRAVERARGLGDVYKCREIGGLKLEFLPKVSGANVVVLENVVRTSGRQYHSISDDVSAITDTQGLAVVVISDGNPETCLAELCDGVPDIADEDGNNASERLVEQHE